MRFIANGTTSLQRLSWSPVVPREAVGAVKTLEEFDAACASLGGADSSAGGTLTVTGLVLDKDRALRLTGLPNLKRLTLDGCTVHDGDDIGFSIARLERLAIKNCTDRGLYNLGNFYLMGEGVDELHVDLSVNSQGNVPRSVEEWFLDLFAKPTASLKHKLCGKQLRRLEILTPTCAGVNSAAHLLKMNPVSGLSELVFGFSAVSNQHLREDFGAALFCPDFLLEMLQAYPDLVHIGLAFKAPLPKRLLDALAESTCLRQLEKSDGGLDGMTVEPRWQPIRRHRDICAIHGYTAAAREVLKQWEPPGELGWRLPDDVAHHAAQFVYPSGASQRLEEAGLLPLVCKVANEALLPAASAKVKSMDLPATRQQ